MPTTITHALAGLGLGAVLAGRPMPWPFYPLSAALGVVPDLDVLAFSFGIPYGSRFGHRGFSHSFCCALLISLACAFLTATAFAMPWWQLALIYFVVVASHALLDGMTNGGKGVAFFAPFDATRYFLPWRPVQVSPIGLAVFSRWGLRAFLSEVVWVWLPLGVVVGGWVVRWLGG